jgi:hypothetical protein
VRKVMVKYLIYQERKDCKRRVLQNINMKILEKSDRNRNHRRALDVTVVIVRTFEGGEVSSVSDEPYRLRYHSL